MKRCIVGGLGAVLLAGGLLTTAPPASAGCQYGGPVISKCDGPIAPDGTWERCVVAHNLVPNGASSYFVPERTCNMMGPGGFDPHIDG
ncbi:MAG: hypothetical protein VYA67_24920 [Actinomycetota bacterium]|uniref:CDGP domain-containing protein n=1 Tax=Mycobacterium lentiflavum TaxID=141349 RepID=A0ABY3V2M2_MYCLN|nr:hypothetical protein [Mycobacterium lentiflavum]MEE3067137.1 hypothetical protein [Actinomycetota bacterium]ULP43500.1 hypothetical protein MJO58_05865 [Mycobacterium lentiflavum]